MFSHVYFVDGLLIDTGHIKVRNAVLDQIKSLDVQQMYLTHFHEDHSGNLAPIQAHFECPVYASKKCVKIMKQPPPISLAQKLTWGDRPAFPAILPKSNWIHTPNYRFALIPIPGHAPDMTALYEPDRKWLFSADLYVHHRIKYFLKEERILEQIQSIQRILKLDFDVLLCGHNPQLEGGKSLLKKKLSFLEDFYKTGKGLYLQSLSAREIFRRMKLQESWYIRLLSHGHLSQMNMVKAAIRDIQQEREE